MNQNTSFSDLHTEVSSCAYNLYPFLTDVEDRREDDPDLGRGFKKECGGFATAACFIGVTTLGVMLIDSPAIPSQADLYGSLLGFQSESLEENTIPLGYKIVNKSEVEAYLNKHADVKKFLELNFNEIIKASNAINLSLEYEGMEDEGWESIYVKVHLKNSDIDIVNNIENILFDKILNHVSEEVAGHVSIIFE